MAVILSHISALQYWSRPDATMPAEYLATNETRALFEQGVHPTERQIKSIVMPNAISLFRKQPAAVDVLVSTRGSHRKRSIATYHCCLLPMTRGMFVRADKHFLPRQPEDVFVCSPEFTLCLLAQQIPFFELLELAYEFCGRYALPDGVHGEMHTRPPLTTPKRLMSFVAELKRMRAVRACRKAFELVQAVSYSPRETNLAMLASLPHKLSGLELDGFALNREIELNESARRILMRSSCKPDLYWEQGNIAIEYEGHEHYETVEQQQFDARKRSALLAQGIEVISIDNPQFANFATLVETLSIVAERTGKAIPTSLHGGLQQQKALHRWLISGERLQR